MTLAAKKPAVQDIVLDEVFPHAPEKLWRALTDGALMARWMMTPIGFQPVVGTHFTFKTTPAGAWDGTIRCQVLEVVTNERLAYAWKGGHESNVGYGSPLETRVTWTLTKADGGTRLRLVHSGFVLPTNEVAYKNMGDGWKKVVRNLETVVTDAGASPTRH
ncbi:MAG: SRPBCC domain-containing protein [Myxococcales bacterium]